MKSKRIYVSLLTVGLIAGASVYSCKKGLDTTNPNVIASTDYFKNSAQLLAGTNAIYAVWHGSNLVGREWFFLHDMRSDDMATGGGQLEAARFQLLSGPGNSDPSNPVMNAVFESLVMAQNGVYIAMLIPGEVLVQTRFSSM